MKVTRLRVIPNPIANAVEGLHLAIDEAARPLEERNRPRLRCSRGCAGCCVDDLTVFEVEAGAIVRRHPEVLTEAPHAPGACAFLDAEGACRIYASRPYVCRTQGLPLRWRAADGSERRDICTLNEAGPPLEELPAEVCWPIGPVEQRLASMQQLAQPNEGEELRRVPLRSLFR